MHPGSVGRHARRVALVKPFLGLLQRHLGGLLSRPHLHQQRQIFNEAQRYMHARNVERHALAADAERSDRCAALDQPVEVTVGVRARRPS